ncbi:3-deoxy-D-manno-octulosonic acid transferase [Thiohalorhabdus sp. Cl-TMA]|uniref:3-deoxy-D-manno-octulosonic acid transferase n=1 Tax=Thiohalorhabdus methylotrophus TaxID=3242694 RepID=A0ABV4TPU9_9GAMM
MTSESPRNSPPLSARLCEGAYRLLRRLVPRLPAPERGRKDSRRDPRGRLAVAEGRPRLWLHAGTRAGLDAAWPLLAAWQDRHPGGVVVLTVVSEAARAEAEERAAGRIQAAFLPEDAPGAAGRFLEAVSPDLALCLGPGLWPNLSRALARRGIPWLWLLGGVYPAPWRWARRLPCLFRGSILRADAVLLGQAEERQALVERGVPGERIRTVGNPLLDAPSPTPSREARQLRSALRGRPLLVFQGTEPGEEELLAGICQQLPSPFTHWLMVLVPADPRRAPELAERFGRFELDTALASRGDTIHKGTRVYLLDAVDQESLFLAAADTVVLGGTWIQGFAGADPLPAAAAGRPVIYGPYAHRHREVLRILEQAGAARQAPNVNNLLAALRRYLQHPGEAQAAGRSGRDTLEPHRGAVNRIADILDWESYG